MYRARKAPRTAACLAAPTLTAFTPKQTIRTGTSTTISGTLANVVPGTPALADKTVTLLSLPARSTGALRPVATTTTDSQGDYSFAISPGVNRRYAVATGQLEQVEDASLNPVFSDLLAPASATVGTVGVQAKVSGTRVTPGKPGRITVSGHVAPAAQGTRIESGTHRPSDLAVSCW